MRRQTRVHRLLELGVLDARELAHRVRQNAPEHDAEQRARTAPHLAPPRRPQNCTHHWMPDPTNARARARADKLCARKCGAVGFF
jgi:hypothetical protein